MKHIEICEKIAQKLNESTWDYIYHGQRTIPLTKVEEYIERLSSHDWTAKEVSKVITNDMIQSYRKFNDYQIDAIAIDFADKMACSLIKFDYKPIQFIAK